MSKLKNIYIFNEMGPMNPHDKARRQQQIRQQNPDQRFGNYEAAIAKVQDNLVSAQKGFQESLTAIEGQEPALQRHIEQAMSYVSKALEQIRLKNELQGKLDSR
jgi:hypothetical protein